MKLAEVKTLKKNQTVLVNLGYKFSQSKYYAKFKNTEIVPGINGLVELCVVVPFEVAEDKCGWAGICLNNNMLVEPRQILKNI